MSEYPGKRGPCTETLESDLNNLLLDALPGSTEIAKLTEIKMDLIEAVDGEWMRHEKVHGK